MTSRQRRFFNDRAAIVSEMLEGYAAANADVIGLSDGLVVRARRKAQGLVGIVVANGSGHEPAMVGWVGHGLLDVNVPGPVFSSPGPARIVAVLVSSHPGDIMNASLALADADGLRLRVKMVVLYDDVASAPKERAQDRRGGAGLFFVWKIVGALAERGAPLDDCAEMAVRVRERTRSIAAAIGTVTHPVSGQALGGRSDNELAVGMGVHGESGTIIGDGVSADEIAAILIGRLVEDLEAKAGSRVALLVNNAGSLTIMELSILYRGASRALGAMGIDVARSWIGSYATTLDQAGFSFALLILDPELEALYDAPAHGAGFVRVGSAP
jgi:phosphoenolpyruvate---glycerone phosphotransferase subunit DhaK